MALILNIETSSAVCAVCLARDGAVIDTRADRTVNSHARVLTLFIEELFKSNHLEMDEVDAVAVSAGPGSYTGLRIGVSVAKGLCYALNKPLIAVPTLLALAGGIREKSGDKNALVMPVVDARRMDIYTAIFDKKGKEVLVSTFATIDSLLEEKLKALGDVWIGGNAMEKCRAYFTSPQIHYTENVDTDAHLLVNIAEAKFAAKEFADTAYFEPLYLNEFWKKVP